MEVMRLQAKPRTGLGKKDTKAVRKEDRVPCVLYGSDEIKHFTLVPLDLRDLVYSPKFKKVEIEVEGEVIQCILKDVQYHPVTERILHMDFLRLVEGYPIKIEIPISFEGVATGLKSGGKLIKKMRKVKVLTTPEHLIDRIVLDTTTMGLGQSQRIKDLAVNEGVLVLNNENIPVATIDIPRALRTTMDDAAAAATAAEKAKGAPAKAAPKAAPAKAAPAKDAAKKK